MKKFLLAGAFALALAGCAQMGLQAPSSPQQTVYTIKATLLTTTQLATQYTTLPRCGASVVGACSQQALVDVVVKSIISADAAVSAAENTVRDPRFAGSVSDKSILAAQNAVSALQAIVAAVK